MRQPDIYPSEKIEVFGYLLKLLCKPKPGTFWLRFTQLKKF